MFVLTFVLYLCLYSIIIVGSCNAISPSVLRVIDLHVPLECSIQPGSLSIIFVIK